MTTPAWWNKLPGVVQLVLAIAGALCAVIGVSFGAGVAAAAAGTLPQRVEVLERRVAAEERRSSALESVLIPMARGQCLDRDPYQTSLMGLDCAALLKGRLPQ